VMRCEKVLELVTSFDGIRGCRRCWPFTAGGGPLVGLEQGRSWCLGGGRER